MTMQHDDTTSAEYEALRSGCGWVDLEDWTVVALTGDDRHSFLHNMCTNEINKLKPGQGCEAFCTDVKGKIVAHVFVKITADETFLVTVPDQAEKLIGHLDRYIIREDVELKNGSEEKDVTLVAGDQAKDALDAVDIDALVIPVPHEKGTALLAITDKGKTSAFRKKLTTACGFAAWNSYRIESGLPLYSIDFNEDHLPQEIARDTQAINFNKGCYLGQETIARLDALGHVNKQLVTVKFPPDSEPQPGIALLQEDKQVGAATSLAWSPILSAPIGIAMIRRGANEVGTQLASEVGQVEVIATPVVG